MGNTAPKPESGKSIRFKLVDGTECKVVTTDVNMHAQLKKGYDTRESDSIDAVVDEIYKEVEISDIYGPITVLNLKEPLAKTKTISKEELLYIIKYTDRSKFKLNFDGGMKPRRRRSEVDMLTS